MPAVVIPIGTGTRATKRATWSLLEVALPGAPPRPWGILLADEVTDELTLRLREGREVFGDASEDAAADDSEEQTRDVLDELGADLQAKAREMGAAALLGWMEGSLSNLLRIGERTAITYAGVAKETVDRLFDEYVDTEVRPFVTHLPVYRLQAAAGKFGEEMDGAEEGWARVPASGKPGNRKLGEDLFVARVVGRSMEPLIPDGSLCVFRAGVTGSRQGRRLLVEETGATDAANRYTVKRYTSRKSASRADDDGDGSWQHERIRLEPLNPEYDAFDLSGDEFGTRFRVIAEFIEVLHPGESAL